MPDMQHILINDHYRIKLMFRGFGRWTGDVGLAKAIAHETESHCILEEEALLPVVRTRVDARLAEDVEEDHEVMRELCEKINALEPGSKSLRPLVHRLKLVWFHHIDHTENEVLTAVAPYRGELFSAGLKMTARTQELLTGADAPKALSRLTTSNTGWGRNGPGRRNVTNAGW